MKLTEEQVKQIIYDGAAYEEDDEDLENALYTVVSQKIVSHDREKNSSDVLYVIRDEKTKKKYTATLLDSVWCGQDEYNAQAEWEEVITKLKVEKPKADVYVALNTESGWDSLCGVYPSLNVLARKLEIDKGVLKEFGKSDMRVFTEIEPYVIYKTTVQK